MATAILEPTAPIADGASDSRDTTALGPFLIKMGGRKNRSFTLNIPQELSDAIRRDAAQRTNPNTGERGVSDNVIAREILAHHYNFDIVDNYSPRLKTALTKEERAAMAAERKEVMKLVADGVRAGKISRAKLVELGLL